MLSLFFLLTHLTHLISLKKAFPVKIKTNDLEHLCLFMHQLETGSLLKAMMFGEVIEKMNNHYFSEKPFALEFGCKDSPSCKDTSCNYRSSPHNKGALCSVIILHFCFLFSAKSLESALLLVCLNTQMFVSFPASTSL